MARAIKWTVPFMSLNGTNCHVDIYEEDYQGEVTTLTGAANPFEYEEDADEDLLNGVIRYRTGYLRVIEETYGDLDDLYPLVNTDRYVEFYYGQTLDFNGYIQAQDFSREWAPGPRVIELPVISPIGLAAGTIVKWDEINVPANNYSPSWYSIRFVIRYALTALNGGYEGFYFPLLMTHLSNLAYMVNELYINSLTFCPFSGTYDKNRDMGDSNNIYKPMTIGDMLTIICTGFGLILHDLPSSPIFQRMDHQGKNMWYGLTGMYTEYPQDITDLTDVASVASADNEESKIMPLSKIEVTYDGSDSFPGMTFCRCRGYARGCAIADREFCTNGLQIGDFEGTFSPVGINNNGLIDNGKVCLGAYGGRSLEEMIIWRPASNWTSGHLIARIIFFEWDGYSARLQFKHRYGTSIENMNNPSYSLIGYATVGVKISTGSTSIVDTGGISGGNPDHEVGFTFNHVGTPKPLVVEFYMGIDSIDWIHAISDVNLVKYETASSAYLNKNKELTTFTIDGTPSNTEGSITRGCGINSPTQNVIRYDGNIITGTDYVDLSNADPRYPHLLQAQDRLQIDMKMTYQNPSVLYFNRMSLWSSNKKWRMLARSFQPWNDVHRLTFHHSPIFDY